MSSNKKIILVIGATGAQGLAVIDALLAPDANGSSSPYVVRALTRDLDSPRAKLLAAKGVECVKGSVEDFPAVLAALKGAYGAWVNTDSNTIGEQREVFAGVRAFELAKQAGTVQHFVWSSLDYVGKKTNYNPLYRAEHYDGKGRVADFLKAQPSLGGEGMTWSCVSTGPYVEMLKIFMFGPIKKRSDGTFVFASPIGNGHVPMIALSDLGFFARYSFDHREEVSGKNLEIASQMVTWDGPDGVVETFKRVTGQKAVYVPQSVDEWMGNFTNTDMLMAVDTEQGSTTWKENFSCFWRLYRDDIITRDMDWIRKVNPKGHSLETWMRAEKYTGEPDGNLLKGGRGIGINSDATRNL